MPYFINPFFDKKQINSNTPSNYYFGQEHASSGPSLSRRNFLVSAGALGTGVLMGGSAFGKSEAATEKAASSVIPQRIMLSCSIDPAHAQNVVWRASESLNEPLAQIVQASASKDLEQNAQTITAVAQTPFESASGGEAFHYAASFTQLQPGTRYCYRVGNGSVWSEWNVFRTAGDQPAPFRFLYVGDLQNDIRMMCSRTMRMAFQQAPDARFVVYAGDLVTDGYSDALWDEFACANSVLSTMIPALPTPGNHDTHHKSKPENPPYAYNAATAYRSHFHLPDNGPQEAPELLQEVYSVDYQGVRMISLNSNALEADAPRKIRNIQLAWLENVLRDNPNRWTLVTHHHPIYSVSKGRDNEWLRSLLQPLYEKYHVDLVLQGHDHTYGRTHKVAADRVVDPGEPGVVYAVSVAGPKMYEVAPKFESLMATLYGQTQMYQVISVDQEVLTYEGYGADGKRMDGFQLKKDDAGNSTYVNRT